LRQGGGVEREKFSSLEAALEEIEARGRELQRTTRAKPIDTKVLGRYEPAQQVAARLELSGPSGLRAGVDVRGDGSASAFVGRVRRRPVTEHGRESVYDALRRVLAGGPGSE
jgi:anti-sigma factor RsiW